jgi:N-[(2S)-2-amino-2-carboxyethyl]-L-glutamate dehydrogenase
MFPFDVLSAPHIRAILEADPMLALRMVAQTYADHHDGKTVNPASQFLRFPDNELNRIIALPASLGEGAGVAGIKWIASFPANGAKGVPRASAVLVLNDLRTGYPFALLESSIISAARTAASAVLAAGWMNQQWRHAASLAVIGAGVIARSTLDTFSADGWRFDEIRICDTSSACAERGAQYAKIHWPDAKARAATLAQALEADVVLFTTTAGKPYVLPPVRFAAGQIVLNISLRDLAPELILEAENVVDDVDHCMKASTSPHLAEQLCGHRDFVTGTLAQLMRGDIALDRSKPSVFSPFGMGILDLALGNEIHRQAREAGLTRPVPDFFGEAASQ